MAKANSLMVAVVAAAVSVVAVLAVLSTLQYSPSGAAVSSQILSASPESNLEAMDNAGTIDSKGNAQEQAISILTGLSSSPHIRADMIISAKRNDGTPIENERFEEIRTELATQFGGVTVLPRFNGTSIRDGVRNDGTNNSGFFVVVENKSENIDWLMEYKAVLRERLSQDRIFMTFTPTVISP
jgi:hypothetical protein